MSLEGNIQFENLTESGLSPKLDGVTLKVTMYEGCYCGKPNSPEQKISIYIPEGAGKDSAILFAVNNAGWLMNGYQERVQVRTYGMYDAFDMRTRKTVPTMGGDYHSCRHFAADKDAPMDTEALIGAALGQHMVIVSYGCRSRIDPPVDGKYLGHTPATIADTKAVIRFLRYNKDTLPAGDVEKIIVTGGSGGGALSAVIGASGNSADYYKALFEIGAAGIRENAGHLESTLRDDVYAVLAYCPINNLGPSDMAYEWTYYETRKKLAENGTTWEYDGTDVTGRVLAASKELHDAFPAYLESLHLHDADGALVTPEKLDEVTVLLMEKEIRRRTGSLGIAEMKKDIRPEADNRWITFQEGDAGGASLASDHEKDAEENPQKRELQKGSAGSTSPAGDDGNLAFSNDSAIPFTYDYPSHLYYVARTTPLKVAPAFSNAGLELSHMNEDSLFGTKDQAYCPFESYSWNHDVVADVGLDGTGLSWDEYMDTEEGKFLDWQIQVSSPIPYLLGSREGTCAPHWYVRHGMADRDTSFANQALLYLALQSQPSIQNLDFAFAWLKPHSGYYDIPEAFEWLERIL